MGMGERGKRKRRLNGGGQDRCGGGGGQSRVFECYCRMLVRFPRDNLKRDYFSSSSFEKGCGTLTGFQYSILFFCSQNFISTFFRFSLFVASNFTKDSHFFR